MSRTFASIFGLTAALALQAQTTVDPGEKISLATGSTAPLAVTTLPTATYRGPGGGVAVIYNNVALTSVDPNNPGAAQTSGVPGAGGPYPALVPVFRPIVALQGWTPRGEALTGVVKDQTALVQLGKLLFWDTQAGSDGQSCASCHFLAGADPRVKNAVDPGLRATASDPSFQALAGGRTGQANLTLTPADFPFFRAVATATVAASDGHPILDPNTYPISNWKATALAGTGVWTSTEVAFSTNDVASSAGTTAGTFNALSQNKVTGVDSCGAADTTVFNDGRGLAVRKVEPRNTPTTVNSVFMHRNFWDDRANNIFNGVNPDGERDPNAFVVTNAGTTERLSLTDHSLASQAVGPPLSDFEMACANKTFPDIGRRLLPLQPLKGQSIARTDSVLSKLIGKSYTDLVKAAFADKYTTLAGTFTRNGSTLTPVTTGGYTQLELNFSLFWGLAVEAYEKSLVSDQTRFDTFHGCDDTSSQVIDLVAGIPTPRPLLYAAATNDPAFPAGSQVADLVTGALLFVRGPSTCPTAVPRGQTEAQVWPAPTPTAAYTRQELQGKRIFENIFPPGVPLNPGTVPGLALDDPTNDHSLPAGFCAACHHGPLLSGATFVGGNTKFNTTTPGFTPADFVALNGAGAGANPLSVAARLQLFPGAVVERMLMGDVLPADAANLAAFVAAAFPGGLVVPLPARNDNILRATEQFFGRPAGVFDPALYDIGTYNIGVTPTAHDMGAGVQDGQANPLSFSRQVAGDQTPGHRNNGPYFVDPPTAWGHPLGSNASFSPTTGIVNPNTSAQTPIFNFCAVDILFGNLMRPPVLGSTALPVPDPVFLADLLDGTLVVNGVPAPTDVGVRKAIVALLVQVGSTGMPVDANGTEYTTAQLRLLPLSTGLQSAFALCDPLNPPTLINGQPFATVFANARVDVDGAQKTPTLRNIALTMGGFHNGGTGTLRQVLEFYNRGGNFFSNDLALGVQANAKDSTATDATGNFDTANTSKKSNLSPEILPLGFELVKVPTAANTVCTPTSTTGCTDPRDAIVAYLQTTTDNRVQCEAAPFDHPALPVSNGAQPGVDANKDGRADDYLVTLAATGAAGRSAGTCYPNTGNLFPARLPTAP